VTYLRSEFGRQLCERGLLVLLLGRRTQILKMHYSRLVLLESFPRITFVKDSNAQKTEGSADRSGSGWKIEREDRTGTGYTMNFDASLVGLDHGLD
jgi:hypothetical protein